MHLGRSRNAKKKLEVAKKANREGRMDGRTERPTDIPNYRVARTRPETVRKSARHFRWTDGPTDHRIKGPTN